MGMESGRKYKLIMVVLKDIWFFNMLMFVREFILYISMMGMQNIFRLSRLHCLITTHCFPWMQVLQKEPQVNRTRTVLHSGAIHMRFNVVQFEPIHCELHQRSVCSLFYYFFEPCRYWIILCHAIQCRQTLRLQSVFGVSLTLYWLFFLLSAIDTCHLGFVLLDPIVPPLGLLLYPLPDRAFPKDLISFVPVPCMVSLLCIFVNFCLRIHKPNFSCPTKCIEITVWICIISSALVILYMCNSTGTHVHCVFCIWTHTKFNMSDFNLKSPMGKLFFGFQLCIDTCSGSRGQCDLHVVLETRTDRCFPTLQKYEPSGSVQ